MSGPRLYHILIPSITHTHTRYFVVSPTGTVLHKAMPNVDACTYFLSDLKAALETLC